VGSCAPCVARPATSPHGHGLAPLYVCMLCTSVEAGCCVHRGMAYRAPTRAAIMRPRTANPKTRAKSTNGRLLKVSGGAEGARGPDTLSKVGVHGRARISRDALTCIRRGHVATRDRCDPIRGRPGDRARISSPLPPWPPRQRAPSATAVPFPGCILHEGWEDEGDEDACRSSCWQPGPPGQHAPGWIARAQSDSRIRAYQ